MQPFHILRPQVGHHVGQGVVFGGAFWQIGFHFGKVFVMRDHGRGQQSGLILGQPCGQPGHKGQREHLVTVRPATGASLQHSLKALGRLAEVVYRRRPGEHIPQAREAHPLRQIGAQGSHLPQAGQHRVGVLQQGLSLGPMGGGAFGKERHGREG